MKTQLHHVYEHEDHRGDEPWLIQPMGKGRVLTLTWRDGMDQARRMAAHLRGLELPPKSQIALFSKNSAWWFLCDLAIWMAGHVTVPLYPTLTPESIGRILEHSESKLIFIGKLDGYEAMAPGIPEGLIRISLPLAPPLDLPSWAAIVETTDPIDDSPTPDPDDLATIVYTSGTTGVPKGVMHTFRTMCAAQGFVDALSIGPNDRLLSYLPLAHVFERAAIETTSFIGASRIYFAESLETFVLDVQRASPTLFASVPRLWQKFQQGVFAKMEPGKLDTLLRIPLVSTIVRKKVLKGLGLSEVRYAISGSAPIPAELIEWYDKLSLELLEGYGMSENFAYSHLNRPGESRPGYVESPLPGVEHKVSDEGEVLVRSAGTMTGYFKAPDLTAEVLDDDGFLRTGDRGEIDDQNRLKITGRVKELFKTSKGKYVAPAPIENELLLHDDIELACVAGADKTSPFGMVVLSDHARAKAEHTAQREALTRSLGEHLDRVNRQLDHHERLAKLVVLHEAWTIENGMLTPTMKLKRPAIEDRYRPSVDQWYDEDSKIIWA